MADSYRAELAKLVQRAAVLVDAMISRPPGWNVLESVRAQLVHIDGDVRAGRVPTPAVLERINIGVIAVREFETTDPELAELLTRISYRYKRLGPPGHAIAGLPSDD